MREEDAVRIPGAAMEELDGTALDGGFEL